MVALFSKSEPSTHSAFSLHSSSYAEMSTCPRHSRLAQLHLAHQPPPTPLARHLVSCRHTRMGIDDSARAQSWGAGYRCAVSRVQQQSRGKGLKPGDLSEGEDDALTLAPRQAPARTVVLGDEGKQAEEGEAEGSVLGHEHGFHRHLQPSLPQVCAPVDGASMHAHVTAAGSMIGEEAEAPSLVTNCCVSRAALQDGLAAHEHFDQGHCHIVLGPLSQPLPPPLFLA
jgi:hypothetical protein